MLYVATGPHHATRARAWRRTPGAGVTLASVDDDEALVTRAKAGDAHAFGALFRRHRVSIARLVRRLGARAEDRDDLIQDAFVQAFRSLGEFRGQSRFGTWLYRVTVNVVLMHRRSQRSRPALSEPPPWAPEPSEQALPDDAAARSRQVEALYRLLDALSDKKRVVFVLHELEGLNPVEIGAIVKAPVLTVRTRLFYARRELMELMQREPSLASIVDELAQPSLSEREPVR